MDCLEYRRLCGADPDRQDADFLDHQHVCSSCAAFADRIRDLDRRLLRAMQVPLPAEDGNPYAAPEQIPDQAKTMWIGMAASLVLGLGLALVTWNSAPHGDLEQDLIAHIYHERAALITTDQAVPGKRLAAVLRRSGTRMDSNDTLVSYARTCLFRGQLVPHLVVQGETGPVTVMILPNVYVESPTDFSEEGFYGTILPASSGSIAVIAGQEGDLEVVSGTISESVRWDI